MNIMSSLKSSLIPSSNRRKAKDEQHAIETMKYIGNNLLCCVLRHEYGYHANLINIINGVVLGSRELPNLTSILAYKINFIPFDPSE